jgi:uncharacterized membrane protein YeaQ/YmgE (transglycosylase-associated protein family)
MALDARSILACLSVGLIVGSLATQFLMSRGYGIGGDIGIGVLGALVGGFVASWLGLQDQGGTLPSALAAFVGAVLLTRLAHALPRRSPV